MRWLMWIMITAATLFGSALDEATHEYSPDSMVLNKVQSSETYLLNEMNKEILLKKDQQRFYIIILVSIMGMVTLFLLLNAMQKIENITLSSDDVINAGGLVLVILGTIIIVVVADTEQQLSSSVGILGAIVGYIFGRNTKKTDATSLAQKED